VLFSTGVGYFQRTGQVEGNAAVELRFKTKDVNDLLKSLTLQDFDGGSVTSVNYSPRDPLNQTLKNLAINLTGNPGLSGILAQIRGRDVSVTMGSQGRKSGTIIGIEQKLNEQSRPVVFLNLLTAKGIQGFSLDEVTSVRFPDPELQMEFELALELLDEGRRTDEKRVTFNFQGQGQRRVQVGYLLETPVWKTTYRLVLGEEKTHFLQGWAIVENPTEEDWRDVRLALVSGRPISFKMNLYQPTYVQRPTVSLQLAPSVRPQTFEEDRLRAVPAPRPSEEPFDAPMAAEPYPGLGADMMDEIEEELDLSQGVQSAAQGAQAGAFFRYVIEHPVSLPRQESAMVPIVNQEVEGELFGVYNPGAHAIHPFNAVKLKNTTGLYLTAGPVTVFEAGTYAGDAQLVSLPGGAERLFSFSLDLDTRVEVQPTGVPPRIVGARISKGILTISTLHRKEMTYRLRSQGERERRILVEHPISGGWNLVEPQEPAERTTNYYRFLVELAPELTTVEEALLVAEERQVEQPLSLTHTSDAQIQNYINAEGIGPRVVEALRGLLDRRKDVNEAARKKQDQMQRRSQIHQEQARIRQNMERLDKDSDLFSRYSELLNEQENLLADIISAIAQFEAEERRLRQKLTDYIQSLEVD
jgi:hypothetical protein